MSPTAEKINGKLGFVNTIIQTVISVALTLLVFIFLSERAEIQRHRDRLDRLEPRIQAAEKGIEYNDRCMEAVQMDIKEIKNDIKTLLQRKG